MSWRNLPPEILRMVLHDKSLTPRDRAKLARTNKNISSIVLPALYGHVVLPFHHGKVLPRWAERLRRTICECPALAVLTKTILVSCWIMEDWCDKLMTDLIQRFYSLQTLDFRVSYHGYSARFSEFKNFRKTLKTGVSSNLRVLKIGYLYISCNEILRYMCFPNIDTLVVTYTKHRWYDLKERLALDGRKSLLKVFDIELDSSRIIGLLDMLSCCWALEHFTCRLFEDRHVGDGYIAEEDEHTDGEDEQREDEDEPVPLEAPAMIPRVLKNCQQTLVSLNLQWDQYSEDTRPGPSALNLESFTNLKTLRISAYLILSDKERWHIPARNAFCQRLPPSLESLAILFPKVFGVFAVFDTYHQYKSANPPYDDMFRSHDFDLNGPYKPKDLEWVITIAEMKKMHLNHLNKLDLIDVKDAHKHCDEPSACMAPGVVRHALDTAGITFALPLDSAPI